MGMFLKCLAAVGFSLLGVSASRAFESNVPGHRIHEEITREAAKAVGWSSKAATDLAKANAAVDAEETHLLDLRSGRPRWGSPNLETYRAEHHFDRGRGATHAEAFRAGAGYLREERRLALNAAAEGTRAEAILRLGRALHALQDLFSHSDFVDLPPEDQRDCLLALWDSTEVVPGSLRLTAFFPNEPRPASPEDPEQYTHAAHSKDAARKNADASGRPGGPRTPSRYEQAHATAVRESILFLKGIRSELPEAAWKRIVGAD
ncbi:MAG: hypothetical protein U0167_05730 [bacterium]